MSLILDLTDLIGEMYFGESLNQKNTEENTENELDKQLLSITFTFKDIETTYTECPIGLCNLEKEDIIIKLKCGHIFLRINIRTWFLTGTKTCPVCKRDKVF